MNTPIPTPTYDRLAATPGMVRQHSKAITSGQRAGERAAQNVYRPYEYEPYGSYDHAAVARRAQEAASLASARARERYAVKVLG
jgi:hypothetical protein